MLKTLIYLKFLFKKPNMTKYISLKNSFDCLVAFFALAGVLGVLQTFIIGKHFIIPTIILTVTVLVGNIAWYGFQQKIWAKYVLFWFGSLTTAHCFFALFWAKKYRTLLGDAFEPICVVLILLLGFLSYQYARENALFIKSRV